MHNKYSSVAEVLKFYITEVVVRRSEDAEGTLSQNRQVLSNFLYSTPKYLLQRVNVLKSGVIHFSLEVQHGFFQTSLI